MDSREAFDLLEIAKETDFPAIVDLVNRAYRGTGPEASWNVENVIEGQRIDESLLRDDLKASPKAQLLVWRGTPGWNNNALVGCVWLEPLPAPQADGVWYLGLLAVDPRQQQKQVGSTVLAAAEAWAKHYGGQRIRMSVVQVRETLIAWYQRRGYNLTGETQPFPYGDNRFGRPLRDDLHFAILEKTL